jgi:hypothetical protein
MSPHSIQRSAWTSSAGLWLFLAICLIGWRVSIRVDQYHPTVACAGHQAQVTFFDSNERNIASMNAARSHSRLMAERADPLFPAIGLEAPVRPAPTIHWEAQTVLPPIYIDSVSLFSNPPPVSL